MREEIASCALHLATNVYFMFTNEIAEEMASFGATGKGDVHCKPVSLCLFFPVSPPRIERRRLWDEASECSLKSLQPPTAPVVHDRAR